MLHGPRDKGDTRMAEQPSAQTPPRTIASAGDALQIIGQTLAELRFGAIQLTIHEGRLVQMDVTEKHRFQA